MFRVARTERRLIALVKNWLGISLGLFDMHDPLPLDVPSIPLADKRDGAALRVSIVTPSFNQGIFIRETISSVLSQSHSELDYVIQDAASVDETHEVISSFADPRLRLFIEKDKGQADALNNGFRRTGGDIMAYLNSDDLLMPGALTYITDFFAARPDVDVVYGDRLIVDDKSRLIGKWRLPPHDPAVISIVDYVPQETLFWRRSAWERVGEAFDDALQFAMDWDLILRFQSTGAKIVHVPIYIGAFRVHQLQKTHSAIKLGRVEMKHVRSRYVSRGGAMYRQLAHIRYLWRHSRIASKEA
jgi:glycosyltransferase involved in cell wall biosynthesis